MNRGISVAILAVGIVLIVMGLSALDSFRSELSRIFTGATTNKAAWLSTGGIVLTIVGGSDIFRIQKAK